MKNTSVYNFYLKLYLKFIDEKGYIEFSRESIDWKNDTLKVSKEELTLNEYEYETI